MFFNEVQEIAVFKFSNSSVSCFDGSLWDFQEYFLRSSYQQVSILRHKQEGIHEANKICVLWSISDERAKSV